ncbi:MAG TPA: M20/M25/M40 family metallo-hydrolase, partial [Roseiflexaceae bacterium]|nr:M20/M25/M40 family metallo-hydrolase [Roseiflexaceae bacterium]
MFSAVRARQDIAAIAHAPRPLSSREHERVRDFLVGALRRMRLTTEIQQAIAVSQGPKNRNAATVQNIVGRLSGTASTRALLLVAHYDSVPTSPGASDNAAGIATILETLRSIRATAPLRNDLIVLFTDGEELGLLGSQAFVAQHRWANDVGVVLNFDARGSSGPSLMYQASTGGGWLIRALTQTTPAPPAASILAEFAKLAAGPSDFVVFDRAGMPGLDFAYIGDWPNYHTRRDTPDTLDPRSVQQHGDTALALTHRLGQMNLQQAEAGDVVYFNLVGPWLVSYPVTW